MRVGKVDLGTVHELLHNRPSRLGPPGKAAIAFRTAVGVDWWDAEIDIAGQGWALTIADHTRVVDPLVLQEPETIGAILKQMVEDHGKRRWGRPRTS